MGSQTDIRQDYSLGEFIPGATGYGLLRHALRQPLIKNGHGVEFGVGSGYSLNVIASVLPAVGFDSFQGLPETWRDGFPKGSLKHDPPNVPNTQLVAGWFADTLPVYDFAAVAPIALAHFDADLYSSTATALQHVGPYLQPSTIVVFDEWWGYPGFELHEQKAWREYANRTGITWHVIGHSEESWAIRIV